MRSRSPDVVLCAVSSAQRSRAERLLPAMNLRFLPETESPSDFVGRALPPRLIVVDPSTAPQVEGILAAHPEVGVVGMVSSDRDILMLAQLGVEDLLRHDRVVSPAEAVRIAGEAMWRGITRVAVSDARAVLPSQLHQASDAIIRGRRMTRVSKLAAFLGVHRHTLRHWCNEAGMQSAERLVTWCRLVLAAAAIDLGGDSVDSVALELEYSSPTGLRNQLKRYTGRTGTDIRHGGRGVVLEAIKREINPESHSSRRTAAVS